MINRILIVIGIIAVWEQREVVMTFIQSTVTQLT